MPLRTASSTVLAAIPLQSLATEIVLSLALLLEILSILTFISELLYLTFRSFIAPRAVSYMLHFSFIITSTIAFFGLELLLLRTT